MNKLISRIAVILLLFGATVLTSCSLSSDEKAERAAAAELATQMEGKLPDPIEAGRTEARKFLVRSWKDSLQLHEQLLEVKALHSRYIMAGEKSQADIFDSIFISTLHTVNPILSAEVEKGMSSRPHK